MSWLAELNVGGEAGAMVPARSETSESLGMYV
jgi:hypothetical protein